MVNKLSIGEIKERIFKTHGDKVKILEETYISTNKIATFSDIDYGKWATRVNRVLNGSEHRKRAAKKRCVPINKIIDMLLYVHGDNALIKEETYMGANKKALFVDKLYGSWRATVSDVIKGSCHPKRGSHNRKKTNINKYGVENVFQSEQIKKKIIKTNLANYGVEYPMQSEIIKKRVVQSNMKKYGFKHTLQVPEIRKRIEKTNMKKYGYRCTSQVPEIRAAQAKSSNNSYIAIHWFSNEDIICQGSYEKATIYYFNKNKIDYLWQVQTFLMPDGRTYTPDCYLPDEDKWIEIKGYFWGDAKEKWNWFHSEKSNSELWNKDRLKKMGIL